MSLAGLWARLEVDPLADRTLVRPKFTDAPRAVADIDPFERFQPNPESIRLLIENHGKKSATKTVVAANGFDTDCIVADRAPAPSLYEKRAPESKTFTIVKGATATTVYDEAGEVIAIYVGGCDEAVLEQYK